MTNRTFILSDELYDYVVAVSLRESELLRRLRAETQHDPMSQMQIGPEQGQFMALLVQTLGARKTLEIGVFTGYSALCVAMALPSDGRIVACDVSEKWTSVARRYWAEAGVEGKIDLRIGPALTTLDALVDEGQAGTFDFAFIDADKVNHSAYFEAALELIRPGGVIAIDNTLWNGKVVDPEDQSEETVAIRALNWALKGDQRVDISLVPIGDGLTLVRKRTSIPEDRN